MWERLRRFEERQRALGRGVDADLVQANRKRWKQSLSLFAICFLLIALQAAVKLSGVFHHLVLGLTVLSFSVAIVLATWARQEAAFLDRPEPKEPPSLWKGR